VSGKLVLVTPLKGHFVVFGKYRCGACDNNYNGGEPGRGLNLRGSRLTDRSTACVEGDAASGTVE
jgi:hypothetical protein